MTRFGISQKSFALVLGIAAICAGQPVQTAGLQEMRAVRVKAAPTIDGSPADAAWKEAAELRLDAEGRGTANKGKKTAVTLRAAVDDQYIYFLLRWQDATEDKTHKSYVWNDEKKAYEAGKELEDNAALSFPIKGKFTANMLSGDDELWDVWHWKAFRTGLAGYAMDRTHVFSAAKHDGKAAEYDAARGKKVWIARPEDEGDSVTKENPAPKEKQAAPPPHYEAVKPSGSAADIQTGHSYKDGWWTVEFRRKLNTGNADDAALALGVKSPMGVAVFDKSEHENHFTAGPITLDLPAK